MTAVTVTTSDHLAELVERHGVPAASVAVLDGDRITEAAAGMANLGARIEATPNTVFQIGSITKVYTATMIMQLVDGALIDLDAPVTTYLEDFTVEPRAATNEVTIRRLLTHTSGIEGDVFDDFGRGDDCVARYVESLGGRPLLHEPGALFSYCNAGFMVLARVIEVLTGSTWDDALRARILEPLGSVHAGTLPEHAVMHRAAMGHVPAADGDGYEPAPMWHLPRAVAPAGAIFSSAREVLGFVAMHLNGGVGPDGARILSERGVRAMQEPQVRVPYVGPLTDAWGLGWFLGTWSGRRVIGHNGGTLGQFAFLRVAADERFGVCLLTNGRTGGLVADELFRSLFERRGIMLPPPLSVTADPVGDLARYEGTYVREHVTAHVRRGGDGLTLSVANDGPFAFNAVDIDDVPLTPCGPDTFILSPEGTPPTLAVPVTFLGISARGAGFVHVGGRAARRT